MADKVDGYGGTSASVSTQPETLEERRARLEREMRATIEAQKQERAAARDAENAKRQDAYNLAVSKRESASGEVVIATVALDAAKEKHRAAKHEEAVAKSRLPRLKTMAEQLDGSADAGTTVEEKGAGNDAVTN